MDQQISVILITKNSEDLIVSCLSSLEELASEIILLDNGSTDGTLKKAKPFRPKTYFHTSDNLGALRQKAYEKANGPWILVIDSDERVSEELKKEIRETLKKTRHSAFWIPLRNHLFGRPIRHGGENYRKLVLFKKGSVKIDPLLVHERFSLTRGTASQLKHPLLHFSYRTVSQVIRKFTDYAKRDARQRYFNHEPVTLKKLFFYGPHMFYARFIKDKGYKDGPFRIFLDGAFAYMEGLTYALLAYYTFIKRPS